MAGGQRGSRSISTAWNGKIHLLIGEEPAGPGGKRAAGFAELLKPTVLSKAWLGTAFSSGLGSHLLGLSSALGTWGSFADAPSDRPEWTVLNPRVPRTQPDVGTESRHTGL